MVAAKATTGLGSTNGAEDWTPIADLYLERLRQSASRPDAKGGYSGVGALANIGRGARAPVLSDADSRFLCSGVATYPDVNDGAELGDRSGRGVAVGVGHKAAVLDFCSPFCPAGGARPAGPVSPAGSVAREAAAGPAAVTPSAQAIGSGNSAGAPLETGTVSSVERWLANYVAPPLTNDLSNPVVYPGGVSIDLAEAVAALSPLSAALGMDQCAKLTDSIRSGNTIRFAWQAYQDFDRARKGFLPWNCGVLRDFATVACHQIGFPPPDEYQLYRVYSKFDVGRRMSLRTQDCLCLVDAICRALAGGDGARASLPRGGSGTSTAPGGALGAHPTCLAERWLNNYVPPRVEGNVWMTYTGDVSVDFAQLARWVAPSAAANAPQRAWMTQAVESGELLRMALLTFRTLDRELWGSFAWAGGEVQSFVGTVLNTWGLSPPDEGQLYPLLKSFGAGKTARLDATNCICLVDAVCRALLTSIDAAAEQASLEQLEQPSVSTFGRFTNGDTGPESKLPPPPATDQHAMDAVEHWVARYTGLPVFGSTSITYSSGAFIDFNEMAAFVAPFAFVNGRLRTSIVDAIENGDIARKALEIFKKTTDQSHLDCSSGEVRRYVTMVFQHYGLAPISDVQLLPFVWKLKAGNQIVLDASQCICLVDAILRAAFHAEESKPLQFPREDESTLPGIEENLVEDGEQPLASFGKTTESQQLFVMQEALAEETPPVATKDKVDPTEKTESLREVDKARKSSFDRGIAPELSPSQLPLSVKRLSAEVKSNSDSPHKQRPPPDPEAQSRLAAIKDRLSAIDAARSRLEAAAEKEVSTAQRAVAEFKAEVAHLRCRKAGARCDRAVREACAASLGAAATQLRDLNEKLSDAGLVAPSSSPPDSTALACGAQNAEADAQLPEWILEGAKALRSKRPADAQLFLRVATRLLDSGSAPNGVTANTAMACDGARSHRSWRKVEITRDDDTDRRSTSSDGTTVLLEAAAGATQSSDLSEAIAFLPANDRGDGSP